MTTVDKAYDIPTEVAEAAILPASYKDHENIAFPAYAWLRKNAPLAKAKLDNYDELWLVSKYDDLMEIERQPEIFSSTNHNPILNDQPSDAFVASLTGGTYRAMESPVFMDAPEHTKIRAIANQWFMPRNVKRFEGDMREIAVNAIEQVLAKDGEVDFCADFALGYPLHVIMSLFGVPEEDEPIMLKLTQEFFGV
ncbi:MAG: Linalool 8-monooxygenase, partial [Frankiales bacterium]|nr:Linalool 8-monooxygenase [Frankiales bacterium]